MAFSESPPPTTLIAPDPATAFAIATVPTSKGGISKTPMGPFQMMVFAVAMTFRATPRSRLRADIETHLAVGHRVNGFMLRRQSFELRGSDVIHRQRHQLIAGFRH